jgi:hypothetical protein
METGMDAVNKVQGSETPGIIQEASCGPTDGKPNHSTGPRTVQGKRRSSQNARKHGLYSRERINRHIRKEDRREYRAVLSRLIEDKQPVGESERFQVELMAEERHQVKRIERLITAVQTTDAASLMEHEFEVRNDQLLVDWRCDLPPLEKLGKLQNLRDVALRNYYRADHELERLQKIHRSNETAAQKRNELG